jgi:hypothetical protein
MDFLGVNRWAVYGCVALSVQLENRTLTKVTTEGIYCLILNYQAKAVHSATACWLRGRLGPFKEGPCNVAASKQTFLQASL